MDMDLQHQRSWKSSPTAELSVSEAVTDKIMDDNLVKCQNPLTTSFGASKYEHGTVTGVIQNDRIWQERFESISEKSKLKIQQIINEVNLLLPVELMLLYLKLPAESKDPPDPLRQPLNPLGSRTEICQTISWIKTHLEEDPDISLQKKGVYEEYRTFCDLNNIKSLSTADFGKVMKQVYPRVRPRRLGTRGNSQYCYSGLRKKIKLPIPLLPNLSDRQQFPEITCSKSELNAACWTIVREWSEGQLGVQLSSLHCLAFHLILKCSIGVGTAAAAIVTATEIIQNDTEASYDNSPSVNKHKEMTMQLQRKIQQKNNADMQTNSNTTKEHKRKIQVQHPKSDHKSRGKKIKVHISPTGQSSDSNPLSSTILETSSDLTITPQEQTACDKTLEYNTENDKIICPSPTLEVNNQLQLLPDFSSFHRQHQDQKDIFSTINSNISSKEFNNVQQTTSVIEGKVQIPRLSGPRNPQLFTSPKRMKASYKAIQPKPLHRLPNSGSSNLVSEQPCDNIMNNMQNVALDRSQLENKQTNRKRQRKKSTNNSLNRTSSEKCDIKGIDSVYNIRLTADGSTKKELSECIVTPLEDNGEPIHFSRERLISISKVSKDEIECYLGSSNNQDHEEELEKYFENNTCEESESMTDGSTRAIKHQQDHTIQQLSQVRQLLEQKFTNSGLGRSEFMIEKSTNLTGSSFKSVPTTPLLSSFNQLSLQTSSSARRRVSFDTHTYEDIVPPSPNTRRKNMNFTPISPGPKSPIAERLSKCSSTSVSPFVSPRNTPIPRARGNSHPYPCQNRIAPIGLLNIATTRKQLKANKKKQNLQVRINNIDDAGLRNTRVSTMGQPMSAPPSPKMKLLQTLLQSKVSYTPDYVQNQQHLANPSNNVEGESSPEIWRLLGNISDQQPSIDSQFRSQSVPLPAIPDSCLNHFSFDVTHQNLVSTITTDSGETSNDFNDIDTFSTSDNFNVNKIIDAIDNSHIENILEGNNINVTDQQQNYNTDSIPSIATDAIAKIERESYGQVSLVDPQESMETSSILVGPRWITRAQSLDIDDYNIAMKYSSRSVPATPVPYLLSQKNMIPEKISLETGSRSYPSTPLTNETFNYTPQGQDFLLNGQPIKEKLTINSLNYLSGNEGQNATLTSYSDIINEGTDALMDSSKVSFNVEGQIDPEEGCDIMNSDYSFEGVADLNGS